MTKQHDHPPKKSKFDLLQAMRKPHGIAIVAVMLGIMGWVAWTFWFL